MVDQSGWGACLWCAGPFTGMSGRLSHQMVLASNPNLQQKNLNKVPDSHAIHALLLCKSYPAMQKNDLILSTLPCFDVCLNSVVVKVAAV